MSARRTLTAACSLLALAGCYTVDNERFARHVDSLVRPGMTVAEARRRLEADGFSCDPRSVAGAVTCGKTRQSLLPYTCIERVDLRPRDEQLAADKVEVKQILCAGL
jgi:hypothetical protein